jgi:two-component system OmpR family sensor kinase
VSLRTRLVFSYILIIIVCLVVIASAVIVSLQSYRDRYTTARLEDIIKPIYTQIRTSVSIVASTDRIWSSLEEQAEQSGIYILLLDNTGDIVRQAIPDAEGAAAIEVDSGELPARSVKAQQGQFTTTDGRTFLYSSLPTGRIFISSKSDATTTDAALTAERKSNVQESEIIKSDLAVASEQVPEAQDTSTISTLAIALPRGQPIGLLLTMIRPFLWAGLATLAISIIVAFILARSIFRPLQRVTHAADDIAHGQYGREIEVAGPKEVRGLALAFNEMSRQVKEAQERLRHFVADVSHQLKSPLTSIHGFARAITDGTADDGETVQKSAVIIQDESRKMMRQVDELLELSRMQSGQVAIAHDPVDLEELLKQCREIFIPRIEEKELHLAMDIPLLPQIYGDFDRLEQVFNNLLDNAIKNSPAGSEIRIEASKTADAVEIRVVDCGPGIPPEQIPYVFQRFYQAMGVRTGVGLGLAIAREIILAHGGDISVTSTPGEKTEFIIRLPYRKAGAYISSA